jgi:pilus assembly protein Flp/PilA
MAHRHITRRTNLKNFNLLLNNFISDESGQDLIEYALVASLIALSAVTLIGTVGKDVGKIFTNIDAQLTATS